MRKQKIKCTLTCVFLFILTAGVSLAQMEIPKFLTGGDISMMTRMEQTGVIFKDGDMQRI